LSRAVLREAEVDAAVASYRACARQGVSHAAALAVGPFDQAAQVALDFMNRRERRRNPIVGSEDILACREPQPACRDVSEQEFASEGRHLASAIEEAVRDRVPTGAAVV